MSLGGDWERGKEEIGNEARGRLGMGLGETGNEARGRLGMRLGETGNEARGRLGMRLGENGNEAREWVWQCPYYPRTLPSLHVANQNARALVFVSLLPPERWPNGGR